MKIIDHMANSDNPVIAYKTRTLLMKELPSSRAMKALREKVRTCKMAGDLLSHRQPDGTKGTHPYQKWQGPHWTLYSLALLDYPDNKNQTLLPLRNQVHDWLLSPKFMKFPYTQIIPGQEDRVRRCASMEGNAIWYSLRLGVADETTQVLAKRLIKWQWPDGGWNCDKRPEARVSSVQETLIPLRGLYYYGRVYHDQAALSCAERAAEYFLRRQLLYRLRDHKIIRPDYGGDITRLHFPIRFYDVLFALLVMLECGKLKDPRCRSGLDLLASKQLSDGGFPLEDCPCKTSQTITSRGSFADWGETGRKQSNPFVSIDALHVLQTAGWL